MQFTAGEAPQDLEGMQILFRATEQNLRSVLPNPQALSPEDARTILAHYSAAIAPNFVPWMTAAALSVRTSHARFAWEENLLQEIRDDHSGMLRNFARDAHAEPSPKDIKRAEEISRSTNSMVSDMHGLKNLTLMACLEYFSASFIPLLAELAKIRGNANLIYTDVHGVADARHAEQFIWALAYEQTAYENARTTIRETMEMSVTFIRELFSTTSA